MRRLRVVQTVLVPVFALGAWGLVGAWQPEHGASDAVDQPVEVRARVERRLERAREVVAQLEEALRRIDAGERVDLSDLAVDFGGFERAGPERGAERPGWREGGGEEPRGRGRIGRPEPAPVIEPEQVRRFIESDLPWLKERLDRAERERPGLRDEMIARVAPRIHEIMAARQDDPEMARLLLAQFKLGADWVDASRRIRVAMHEGKMTREQAVSHFVELAERQYELREQITRHEIERLRATLAEKEAELDRDDARRDEVIRNMAENMVRRLSSWRGRGEGGPGSDRRPERDRPERSGDD